MRKLQLADICGYFPYNIEFSIKEILGVKTVLAGPFTQGVEYNNRMVSISWIYRNIDNGIKPILRPMSDLCKPIIVEGYNNDEEFVPLQKIAEIYGYLHNGELVGNLWGYDVHICDDYQDYYFGWDKDWFYHFNLYGDYYEQQVCNGEDLPFKLEIIDLLNQLHFDYRGLIEEGLAVDINKINKTK